MENNHRKIELMLGDIIYTKKLDDVIYTNKALTKYRGIPTVFEKQYRTTGMARYLT